MSALLLIATVVASSVVATQVRGGEDHLLVAGSSGNYTVTQVAVAPGGGAGTGLAVLSDGRVVMARQLGTVSIHDPATGSTAAIRNVNVAVPSTGQIAQAGLLDITTENDLIYVSYMCWTTEPTVVHCVDELSPQGQNLRTRRWGVHYSRAFTVGSHNGGGIASDGTYVYVGTGDDLLANDPGQDPSSLKGKIVRLPISTLAGPQIVAMGVRQPFALIEHDDVLYEFDVGWNSWEEINRIVPSVSSPPNLGWLAQGDGDDSAWLCYRHPGISGATCDEPSVPDGYAIMGGAIVDGHVWFADHPQGWVGRVPLDRSGPFQYAATVTYPTKLATHPNGVSVYVLGRGGALWRIDPPAGTVPTSTPASAPTTPPATPTSAPTTTPTTVTTTAPPTGMPPSISFGDESIQMSFPITVDDVDGDAVSARFKVEMAHADADGGGEHEHPVVPWTDFDPALGATAMWEGSEPHHHENTNIWWRVYVESTDAADNSSHVVLRVEMPSPSIESEGHTVVPTTAPTSTSTTTTIAAGGDSRNVSFVVGTLPKIPSNDLPFLDRMLSLGYDVTVYAVSDVDPTELDGSIVVLSTSVVVSTARLLAAQLDGPVITWEPYVSSELGFSSPPNWKTGERHLSGSSISLVGTHPVLAGLPDTAAVFSAGGDRWSAIYDDALTATALATASSNPSQVVVAATDRAVLLPWTYDSQVKLTADGWRLFDNALSWASGLPA